MTKATFKSLFGVTLTLHPTYTDTQTHRHTDLKTFVYYLLISTFAFAMLSCNKNEDTLPAAYQSKPIFETDPDIAKSKVLNFLSYVNKDNIGRDNFSDTEVNEGAWLIEAASNYEYNWQLSGKDLDTIKQFTIVVNNVLINNTLKLSGADLTAKYTTLTDAITQQQTTTLKAAAIDASITNVTNTATTFTVQVMYVKPYEVVVDPFSDTYFTEAETLINQKLNGSLGATGFCTQKILQHMQNCGSYWVPNVAIVEVNLPAGNQNTSPTINSDFQYIEQYARASFLPNYDNQSISPYLTSAWSREENKWYGGDASQIDQDKHRAYIIGRDVISTYLQQTYPGQMLDGVVLLPQSVEVTYHNLFWTNDLSGINENLWYAHNFVYNNYYSDYQNVYPYSLLYQNFQGPYSFSQEQDLHYNYLYVSKVVIGMGSNICY